MHFSLGQYSDHNVCTYLYITGHQVVGFVWDVNLLAKNMVQI